MSSSSSSSERPIRRRERLGGIVWATGLLLGCSATQVDEAATDGTVVVGDIDATIADVECGAVGESVRAGGVAAIDDELIAVFDVTVDGDEAQAVVRTLRGDEVVSQQVGAELAAATDDNITVTGVFTGFEGPTQTGETEGTLTFTCSEDRDPGGGAVSIEGQEVAYDLVYCLETDDLYELRAWNTDQEIEQLTATRSRGSAGWQDRLTVLGSVTADHQSPSAGPTAVEVTDGLFTVRGARVTAETPAFGEDRLGALEATCGIDLSIVTD